MALGPGSGTSARFWPIRWTFRGRSAIASRCSSTSPHRAWRGMRSARRHGWSISGRSPASSGTATHRQGRRRAPSPARHRPRRKTATAIAERRPAAAASSSRPSSGARRVAPLVAPPSSSAGNGGGVRSAPSVPADGGGEGTQSSAPRQAAPSGVDVAARRHANLGVRHHLVGRIGTASDASPLVAGCATAGSR
jgi:hypothetical protein